MPERFSEDVKTKVLLWCDRHCCLCEKACGTDIEVAHIAPEGGNDIDNAIPLCYDCHAKIGRYNEEHPRGNKFKPGELKARREQIYERYTRHLVPPIHFYLDQRIMNSTESRKLPFIGFRLQHFGDSLPVNVKVEAKVILDGEDKGIVEDKNGYYNGKVLWNINPRTLFFGGFSIKREFVESGKQIMIEIRVTVIDQYEREHKFLPQCWRYIKERNVWNLEPRSFTEWD